MAGQPPSNQTLRTVLPWVAATAVVLTLAVTAGLVAAYLVASGRAVDAPGTAVATATPQRSPSTTATRTPVGQTTEPTIQPRRTPTPRPEITPEPSPFEHEISRGESLTYIAGLYCTTVEAIAELNGITNPNRIQIGQILLIPGGGCPSPD